MISITKLLNALDIRGVKVLCGPLRIIIVRYGIIHAEINIDGGMGWARN